MSIILFDGVCNLCNNVVSFLIKYDKNNVFKFAAIQTNAGENIIHQNNVLNEGKSVILIKEGTVFFRISRTDYFGSFFARLSPRTI